MAGGVGCVGVGAVWEKLGEGEDDVMVGDVCENEILCSDSLWMSMWNEFGVEVVSGVEMSTCEAMCAKMELCVLLVYECPCRMRLGGICEWCGDVNM